MSALPIELERRIDYVSGDIHSHLLKNRSELSYHGHEALIRDARYLQGALRGIAILAQIPETRAILQEILQPVLDSDLQKRLSKLEAEMDRLRGDNR